MDHDLVLRAQRGDQRAFEALTVASHSRLYKAAHGVLRDRHLAEDATQQAFIDIMARVAQTRQRSRCAGGGSNPVQLALVVTGSLLSIIPLVAAFIILQRYWQSGLSAGSVKG